MSFTVGRVGFDVAWTEVEEWNQSGDQISISGILNAATVADAKVLRQQLSGYVNNMDEEIVPVTWSEDSTVDGFYRVTGASVSTVPMSLTAGWFEFSLSLERMSGYGAPGFESVLSGALRVNAHSIVSATSLAWHSIPSATDYYHTGGIVSATGTRTSADGAMLVQHLGGGAAAEAIAKWSVPPASALIGAAKIEVGTTLRTVVGHQIENLPEAWRISNGLLRVTPVASESRLDVSCFDGTQWETAVRFDMGRYHSAAFDEFDHYHTISVLRNSPEAVGIRLATRPDSGSFGVDFFTVDLMLRRGARLVEITTVNGAGLNQGMIRANSATACTALTGSIRETANNASGNRFVLAAPQAKTDDLTNGSIRITASNNVVSSFGLGFEIDGSSAAALETAQSLTYQYMCAMSEQLTVRGR